MHFTCESTCLTGKLGSTVYFFLVNQPSTCSGDDLEAQLRPKQGCERVIFVFFQPPAKNKEGVGFNLIQKGGSDFAIF